MALVAFTFDARKADEYVAEVLKYFACESKGNGSCPASEYQDVINPELNYIGTALLGLFPVINLVYILNINEIKLICHRYLGRKKERTANKKK